MSHPTLPFQAAAAPVALPFAPVAAALDERGLSLRQARELLRVKTSRLHQMREVGLTVEQADRYACRLGLHPVDVWGDAWIDACEAAYGDQLAAA